MMKISCSSSEIAPMKVSGKGEKVRLHSPWRRDRFLLKQEGAGFNEEAESPGGGA